MEIEKQTLQWFEDLEMSEILCTLPNGDEKIMSVMSSKDAKHYFEMQDRGYQFRKKVTVHKAVDKSCVSCEG